MSHPKPRPVRVKKHPVVRTPPAAQRSAGLLPRDHMEWVEAWGMATRSMAHVYRPSTVEGIASVYADARKAGRTIAFRGAGCSYGDPFQNREEVVVDISRMTRVLDWDPSAGLISLEPGVTIAQLWRYVLGDGYWPPVVSGTMMTTMGGCASMNIHGKNAYIAGPFGNHVQSFDLLLPSGEVRTVTRAADPALFRAAIGGFGMLGAITRVTLKLKHVYSGVLEVYPRRVRNFFEMAEAFEENAGSMDYMVGWCDGFPASRGEIGRGEMHFARQLPDGADPKPAQTMRLDFQDLPDTLFGILPKSILHKLLAPFMNDIGMRFVNTAKYFAQRRPGAEKPYFQSHAAFHFLLDYVPNWKLAYRPKALIQYQTFVPRKEAPRVFTEQLRLCHRRGIYPYLGVTKKHIPDDFLISHGVDGYSMALDFPVTRSNRERLWTLCHEMDELVLAAGGRFYLAKDSTMRPGTAKRYISPENIELFRQLKATLDPEGLLCSDLYRRVFGPDFVPSMEGAFRPARSARAV